METVYGIGQKGEARKTFVEHVHSRMRRVVRGHDKPYAIFDNFGSWPSGASGDWLNSDEFELHSLRLLAESQEVAGCHFDFCNIHFWVDPAGDMGNGTPTISRKASRTSRRSSTSLAPLPACGSTAPTPGARAGRFRRPRSAAVA